jgi:hypothetical protein
MEFLFILTVIGLGVVWFLVRRRRTHFGNRMLKDGQRLVRALRRRAATIRQGAMTSDAMLLEAVFGISALPATGFADFLHVYKKAASSGGGCGSSCGAGCGGGGGCGARTANIGGSGQHGIARRFAWHGLDGTLCTRAARSHGAAR